MTFYYTAVLWAVEEGITAGMTKTTFVPDNTCTRGQIVTFLYRYMTSDEPLTIVFRPDDYYMTCSQEDAEFTVVVEGGEAHPIPSNGSFAMTMRRCRYSR